ncbi:hypothetical protein [Micromonospora sp. KC721]|uniref:hypothetical protein n=1 Tax=Micromonospora sp. KC721 TaxID=2530380 RepID=UPI0010475AC4|nr:hypothetical protein [Micromonospora sp. KC721]TDB82247.1 hypothetical protein E1182_02130 [Micromonospora sp. KC721]
MGTTIAWTARSGEATAKIAAPRPAREQTVTLLTGDRIIVHGDSRRLEVDRAPGREKASFLTRWERGALHVVPTDAAALLGSGRLDPRLFDVTRLLRAGDNPPLVVAGDARRVRPEGRAALWRDLAAGRLSTVRLDEPARAAAMPDAETYELTVRYLDRTGRPATDYTSFAHALDGSGTEALYDSGGTVTVQLPRGRYQLGTFIPHAADDPFAGTMLVQPVVELTGPRTVVMDARLGKPVSVSVPAPDAVPGDAVIGYSTNVAGEAVGGGLIAGSTERQYTAQVGAPADRFTALVAAGWRQAAEGDSAYAYHLAYYQHGRMWTGLDRHPTHRELATVRTRQAQTAAGTTGLVGAYYELPGVPWGMRWAQPGAAGPLPRVATEYYNTDAGVHWEVFASEQLTGEDYPTTLQWHHAAPVAYRPGRVYQEDWNKGVFAPVFPPREHPTLWVTRSADLIMATPSWYGDAAGRDGYGPEDATYSMRLYQDGELVGESDRHFGDFPVPAEPRRYRLEIAATRGQPQTLSTEIATAWTFGSAHVGGDTPVALPLSAVRFTPVLDDRNVAPGGRAYPVPVVVSPQPGSAAGALMELSVDVSYDDGATWSRVEVRRTGAGGTAWLRHPAGPGYVSLRATATDSEGNSVTQTVVRAYRLRAA